MTAIDELNQKLGLGPKLRLPTLLQQAGYVPLKAIGKGAFGQAVLVEHKSRGQHYVVKDINMTNMSARDRKEAHNEIEMLQRLNHPNIVKYVDYSEEANHLYIVMEYADGGDLYKFLQKNRRPGRGMEEDLIVDVFSQVVVAIRHMHNQKILHRDLKPQNIFMTTAGQVKLGDFGISKALQNTMAMAHTQCGTPYYFSPEICLGKPYNAKSDVWALGCILYELCTGRPPFDAASVRGLMDNIAKQSAPRIPKTYSDELSDLVAAMLRKDPGTRPSTDEILHNPRMAEAPAAKAYLLEVGSKPDAPRRKSLAADGESSDNKAPRPPRGNSPYRSPKRAEGGVSPQRVAPSYQLAAKQNAPGRDVSPVGLPPIDPHRASPANNRQSPGAYNNRGISPERGYNVSPGRQQNNISPSRLAPLAHRASPMAELPADPVNPMHKSPQRRGSLAPLDDNHQFNIDVECGLAGKPFARGAPPVPPRRPMPVVDHAAARAAQQPRMPWMN